MNMIAGENNWILYSPMINQVDRHYYCPCDCEMRINNFELTHAGEFIGCEDESLSTRTMKASHRIRTNIKAPSIIYYAFVRVCRKQREHKKLVATGHVVGHFVNQIVSVVHEFVSYPRNSPSCRSVGVPVGRLALQ